MSTTHEDTRTASLTDGSDPDLDPGQLEDIVQLIRPDGTRAESPGFDPWVADVSDSQLVSLYEDMVVIRRIDTEATALQRQGELALWAPLFGQEAAQIGSGRALRKDDFVFSSYRENGVAYTRGVDLGDMLKVWRGVASAGWDPYEVGMATPAVIIGAQTLHATGYALGCKHDGVDSVSIAYFGDGATSQGDVNEAMVFASSFQAPVIFFCQNNQWAISEPVGLQAHRHISDRAPGFGIPSIRVDGNDVLAVLAATRIALDRARSGGGPTFIEAVTYRMGPHTTSDDPKRYRPAEDLEVWGRKDPISRLGSLLEDRGALTDETAARVQSKADAVAREMRAACVALDKNPDPMTVFDEVYVEPHSGLERQKSQYAAYLASFEGGAS
ncbi:pyruvate dehydrogenase E1 component alpha subunit [Mycetocola sp. CAN_C7]|uniref:pyruvate dehydrogenase (acetyl-transferring) E1 component subunit alpha n=1 Tax=Mycetocola sp. CAN_C7 TaxID=2787724 RepID=UPI001A1C5BD3